MAQAASMTEPDLTLQTLMQETRDMLDRSDTCLSSLPIVLDGPFPIFSVYILNIIFLLIPKSINFKQRHQYTSQIRCKL